MLNWYLIEAIKPPANTHVLTVNARLECPTIIHNIADGDSRLTMDVKEQGYHGVKHEPTHWAHPNFPQRFL